MLSIVDLPTVLTSVFVYLLASVGTNDYPAKSRQSFVTGVASVLVAVTAAIALPGLFAYVERAFGSVVSTTVASVYIFLASVALLGVRYYRVENEVADRLRNAIT